MKILGNLLGILVLANTALAGSAPKAFNHPLATLKKGPVSFKCYEPTGVDGDLGTLLRFKVTLEAPAGIPAQVPFSISNLEQGEQAPGLPAQYYPMDLPNFSAEPGQILGVGTPNESLRFEYEYNGKPLPGQTGAGREMSLSITQDLKTGMVFARYADIAVIQRAPFGCGGPQNPCFDQTRTIYDIVYLCEPGRK